MQVTSINNYSFNTNFKATLSPKLEQELLKEAKEIGPNAQEKLTKKIAEIANWGRITTELQKVANILHRKAYTLALNHKDYPAYFDTRILVNQRLSLLEQFFSLRPDHITSTEKRVMDKHKKIRREAADRIADNSDLLKLATGDSNFDANSLGGWQTIASPREVLDFAKLPVSYLMIKYGNKK